MARRVAIIGAGMAGLAAARRLTQSGVKLTIFEKSRGLGGRVATRRINGCILDHGAQIIKPDGTALADVMLRDLPTEELVSIEQAVRPYQADGTLLPPDPSRAAERQFAYRRGLTTLPKLLARSLPADSVTIRYEMRIGRLEEREGGILLRDENGEEVGWADEVILTAPAPQAADLLQASPLHGPDSEATRLEALRAVPYSSCLSVLLGYAPGPPAPAYALIAEDRSRPLLWLAFEQTKAPERAPNGEVLLIAQLGAETSRSHYDAPDADILALTLAELRPLFGTGYDFPLWSQVKRWRYSQPRSMADFATVNPPGSRVLVCGDALRPENGRIHQAYASGLEAAERLIRPQP